MARRGGQESLASQFYEKLPKLIFIVSIVLTVLIGVFLYGVLAHRYNLPPVPLLQATYSTLRTELKSAQHHHLQPSRGQGAGVTVNQGPDDGAIILMTGFFDEENQARLIRRDGTIVKKWSLDYFKHFPDPNVRACNINSPLLVDTHGALVTEQGELVFNYERCGTVKLDPCGGLIWAIDKATHHSLIRAENGGYWLLGRKVWLASENPERFPPFSSLATNGIIYEDTLLRISDKGEVLEEVSIPDLMRRNGLEAQLTANGINFSVFRASRDELVHANKVAQLSTAMADSFPLFAAGDLAISMRQLNLIMVIDPDTKTIKWYQTGPWLRQHDPEFRPDGRISIFNNNVYRTAYVSDQTVLSTPFTTNIIAVDPVTRTTEVLFGEKPGQKMLSVIRGQHEILKNDGILITEFDAGRVLEIDAEGQILWEYVNRYNDDFVGEITDSALYPNGYFKIDWEMCSK